METNRVLADKLRQIGIHYQLENDPFRAKTFLNGAKLVENHPEEILTGAQAQQLRGIGKSLGLEIDKILTTGTSPRLQSLQDEASQWKDTMDLLTGVYGIGPVQAQKFMDAGITTLEDLSTQKLTDAQRLGLDFYHDLQQRIPRSEIEQFSQILSEAWVDFETQWEIVGSFRRRADSSGDIDVLVKQQPGMKLSELVDALAEMSSGNLFDDSLLVGTLAEGSKKFMGIIQLENNPARRLDILMVPEQEWPYALVYFTGSKEFNVKMRQRALDQGLTLNEHRLADSTTGRTPVFWDEDLDLPFEISEESDLFEVLDMDWVEPWDR